MKNASLLCALIAAAFQLSTSVAFAAGVPVSPAPNETVNTPQPTMIWTVPDGETVSDILISNSRHNDNGFLDRAIDDGQVSGKTSYHFSGSILVPGDYYWQLSGIDAEGNPAASKIQHFVVPAVIQFSPVKAKWNPHFDNGRPVDFFVATIRCNLDARPTILLKVYQSETLLKTESFSANWCVDMKPYAFANTYQKPVSMPAGTRLTAQFIVKAGKYTVKSAMTPFRTH